MSTMNRVFIITFLFLIPPLAWADNIVEVVMSPVTLYGLSDLTKPPTTLPNGGLMYPTYYETIGARFDWNTTTNIVSDAQVFVTGGPFFHNMEALYTFMPGGLDFINSRGDIFQMNSSNHAGLIQHLTPEPGIYVTDLWYQCSVGCFGSPEFILGTAMIFTEEAEDDPPLSTPEPGSLLLLGLGITALGLAVCVKNGLA